MCHWATFQGMNEEWSTLATYQIVSLFHSPNKKFHLAILSKLFWKKMHYILVYRYKNTYITIKVFIHVAPPDFETYTNMAKQSKVTCFFVPNIMASWCETSWFYGRIFPELILCMLCVIKWKSNISICYSCCCCCSEICYQKIIFTAFPSVHLNPAQMWVMVTAIHGSKLPMSPWFELVQLQMICMLAFGTFLNPVQVPENSLVIVFLGSCSWTCCQ